MSIFTRAVSFSVISIVYNVKEKGGCRKAEKEGKGGGDILSHQNSRLISCRNRWSRRAKVAGHILHWNRDAESELRAVIL